MASAHRTYKEECSFIERQDENSFLIKKGFVPNMKVTLTTLRGEVLGSKPKKDFVPFNGNLPTARCSKFVRHTITFVLLIKKKILVNFILNFFFLLKFMLSSF